MIQGAANILYRYEVAFLPFLHAACLSSLLTLAVQFKVSNLHRTYNKGINLMSSVISFVKYWRRRRGHLCQILSLVWTRCTIMMKVQFGSTFQIVDKRNLWLLRYFIFVNKKLDSSAFSLVVLESLETLPNKQFASFCKEG